jgi:hypothetical protein
MKSRSVKALPVVNHGDTDAIFIDPSPRSWNAAP